MAFRKVKGHVTAQPVDMGGIPILQPIPSRAMNQLDPFLLIHHWKQDFEGGQHPSSLGVGPHPHRGFAPVTFIYSGAIHHRDSQGNNSIVGQRGTQWMYAGSGLTHSERPSAELASGGGTLELIQFWVNVPAEHKMDTPAYYPLQGTDASIVHSEDGLIEFVLAAGSLLGKKGPVPTHRSITAAQVYFEGGGSAAFELPDDQNTLIYVLEGELDVNGTKADPTSMVWFEPNTGLDIELQALSRGKAMLLSGEPLGEPVASYGPFVMNTSREIMQALEDAQMGRMGSLTESFENA